MAEAKAAATAEKKAAPKKVKVQLNATLADYGAGLSDPYTGVTICAAKYDKDKDGNALEYQTVERTAFVDSRIKADELIEVQ